MGLKIFFICMGVIASAVFTSGCGGSNQSVIANQLMQAYGGACRSTSGVWTQAALGQTQALVRVLEELRQQQNSQCRGVTAALDAVQNINAQMNRIMMNDTVRDYRILEEKRQDLVDTLSRFIQNDPNTNPNVLPTAAPNPELIAALRTALYQTEVDLAGSRASVSANRDAAERESIAAGLANLTRFSRALLSQNSSLSSCYSSAPHLAVDMATALLAIGGSFASPIVGASFTAIGNMLQDVMNFIRNSNINQAIVNAQDTQMQTALTCGIEAMSNVYCDAASTKRFLNLAAVSASDQSWQPTPVWKGMDLIGRKLPLLNQWLLRVAGGVPPPNPEAAGRLSTIWNVVTGLQNKRRAVQGVINSVRNLIGGQDPNSPVVRTNTQRAFIDITRQLFFSDCEPMCTSTAGSGPVTRYAGIFDVICELSGDPTCVAPTSSFTDPIQFLRQQNIVDGLAGLELRALGGTTLQGNSLQGLLSRLDALAQNELQREISLDADTVIAEATTRTRNTMAPVQIMESLVTFLNESIEYTQSHNPTHGDLVRMHLARATMTKLQNVIDKVNAYPQIPARAVMENVFTELQLLSGPQVITTRITNLLRSDMEFRIIQGDLPPELTLDLRAVGGSLVERMQSSGLQVDNMTPLLYDISGGQSVSQQNLQNFVTVFAPSIDRALKALKTNADLAREPLLRAHPTQEDNRPNRTRLAQLCMLVLTTTMQWPSGVDMRTCAGTVLETGHPNSHLQLRFDDLAHEMRTRRPPLSQRMCTYTNFLRAARLFQLRPLPHGQRTLGRESAPATLGGANLLEHLRWPELKPLILF